MSQIYSKKEKAKAITQILEDLYPSTPIPLKHKDSYTLLVAVLLSAQCTDERVNKVTPALFAKADTPHKMIELEVATIKGIIRPCGLSPRKSQAIFDLSHLLIEKHNGDCLLYTSPSPRDRQKSRMPSSA